jgi:hypothetical protein
MFRTEAEFGRKFVVMRTKFGWQFEGATRDAGSTFDTSVLGSAVRGRGSASTCRDAGLKPVIVSDPYVPCQIHVMSAQDKQKREVTSSD